MEIGGQTPGGQIARGGGRGRETELADPLPGISLDLRELIGEEISSGGGEMEAGSKLVAGHNTHTRGKLGMQAQK